MKLIPVARDQNPQQAFYDARAALESGKVVALFPQGTIHLDSEPLRLKRGVAVLAGMTGAAIHPVRIDGVAGQGKLVGAIFQRSNVRTRSCTPLRCNNGDSRACIERLAQCLARAQS
jgi:1-acyl-sn-glycerol-3-phosphate acyltransferase